MSAATRKLREALVVWDGNVRAAEQAASVTARMRTLADLLVAGGFLAEAARAALGPLVTEGNGETIITADQARAAGRRTEAKR